MNPTRPISVVIVNFNAGELLTACVRSVLDSSVPVEVVVSDNGSRDGSLHALRRALGDDARVRIVENGANLGFAKANNLALRHCHGDDILFLNPDCVIQPDTLARMRAIMSAHPRAGMGGGLILNADGSEQKGGRRRVPTPWRTLVRVFSLSRLLPDHPWFRDFDLSGQPLPAAPVAVDAISGSFMFVRRAAMDKVGIMDEGYFLHCEDLDWCMRFRQAGFDVLFVPAVAVTHYKGVCGVDRPVRVMWHMHKGMVRFYRKFFRHEYSVALMWAVAAAVWARFFVMAAFMFGQHAVAGAARALHLRRAPAPLAPRYGPGSDRAALAPHFADAPGVIVTGATSQIGQFLLPRLAAAGYRVFALSRRPPPAAMGAAITWVQADVATPAPLPDIGAVRTLIHLAPLWLLPGYVESAARLGVRRVLAFGSTSTFSKLDSSDAKDRALAARLAAAESECVQSCSAHGIDWTLFRPTLIYGCGMDRNVTAIAQFIRRFGFFVLAGRGRGLRQPVHADDLAAACVAAIDARAAYNRDYNLSGGQVLRYREMVERIFEALGRTPRIVEIPLPLLRVLVRAFNWIPGLRHITPAMAERMNQDLSFDHTAATRDFGYRPRRFLDGAYVLPAPGPQARASAAATAARARRVMITGANGFIGSALCEHLAARGYRVIGVVRRREAARRLDPALEVCVVPDIAGAVDWAPLVQGVDCIVHLAAFVHETPVGLLPAAKARYQRLNVDATRRLAQAAAAAGVKRLIYISTVKVHGEKSLPDQVFTERMALAPKGPYAESKLQAEQVLRAIERDTGTEVVIIRPPLVYGPGVKANFLRLIRLVEQGIPLPLANVDNRRSFVYLGNLIDALVRCIEHPAAAGQTFLVSDGEDVSTPQLVRNLAIALGREARLVAVPLGLLRFVGGLSGGLASVDRLVDSLLIDDSRIRATLDWTPPYTMMQGLEATARWYAERFAPLRRQPYHLQLPVRADLAPRAHT